MLEAIDLMAEALLVLLKLLDHHLQLGELKLTLFALDVFVLVGFEQLSLGVLVLFVLTFKVPKFGIQLIQSVL